MGSSILDGAQHADRVFDGEDLSGETIEGREFLDCRFVHCVFAEATFMACRFSGCTFRECDLSLVKVLDSRFSGVVFEDSKAIGIDWTRADWPAVTLEDPIGFRRTAINHSTFLGLALPGLRVIDCVAREADFREAVLSKADFSGTDLTGSLFGDTDLREADLGRARNYHIVAGANRLTGAKFSLPEALALLHAMDIDLID